MFSREIAETLTRRIEEADSWQLRLLQIFEKRQSRPSVSKETNQLGSFLAAAGVESPSVGLIPDLVAAESWQSADLMEILSLVQHVRYDAARILEEGFGDQAGLDSDLRYVVSTAMPTPAASKEQWISAVRNFIYDAPGLFMAEIHRQLAERGYPHSYSALTERIRELEQAHQILTIGFRQGIKRYCFPHPDRIQRQNAYGRDMAFRGQIKANITSEFVETKAPYDVYVLNTHIRPLLILTPFASQLGKTEAFEGFGPVSAIEDLPTTYGLQAERLPKEVREVVRPRQLFALESANVIDGDRTPIPLPPNYVA